MQGKFEDLYGKRFGRLIVTAYMGNKRWLCRCECGNKSIVITQHLKSEHTKSCGCLNAESRKRTKNVKHGFWNTNYSKGTMKFYKMWQSLKARCDNINNKCYKNYGGRGIVYDPRWKDFEEFKKDMYFKYLYSKKQLKIKSPSIERIDVNGNYNFENCTFVRFEDQMKNSRAIRSFIAVSPKGEEFTTKNVNEFSKKYGLNPNHVYECLDGKANHHKGWKFQICKD